MTGRLAGSATYGFGSSMIFKEYDFTTIQLIVGLSGVALGFIALFINLAINAWRSKHRSAGNIKGEATLSQKRK